MIEIKYNNNLAYCRGSSPELARISNLLTYTPKGAFFSRAFKSGRWDGKKSFYYAKWNAFPTGLLPYVYQQLPELEFKIQNVREEPPHEVHDIELWDEKNNCNLELRDYQLEAVVAFLTRKRGIISLSTRAGKTVIGIKAISCLKEPSLFIVHTKDLLRQTVKEFKSKLREDNIGIIGDGKWEPSFYTVGMVQTLSRSLKESPQFAQEYLDAVRVAVFDEIHRASDSYQIISKALRNAPWRLGLSATALISGKENSLRSMALTGPILYEIEMKTLADQKHIAKPKVFFIQTPVSKIIREEEWNDIYYSGIVYNETRNDLIADIALTMKKEKRISSLILIEKIEHGHAIERRLSERGRTKFVWGNNTSDERKNALLELQAGQLDFLIASRIFNEGIDIPLLECVIVASGWKSPILTIQRYGRGVTKTEQKEETIVFDFYDSNHRLLEKHSLERLKICKKNKAFEVIEISELEEIKDHL